MRTLVILGMHRSGTSLVARACSLAGIDAGPPGDMLAAQDDNPAGFFEHRDLVGLNDRLLTSQGGSWFDPPETLEDTTSWMADARGFLGRLGARGEAQCLLKDPRLCLTWPCWRGLLDDALLLYVYRSPLAVARSLQRRNRFPLQFGLQLWEYYNRCALQGLADAPYVALDYGQLLSEPGRLAQSLRELGERGFDCDGALAADVIDPALCHEVTSRDDPDTALLSDAQRRLADQCRAVCHEPAGPQALPMEDPAARRDCRRRLHDTASFIAPLAELREVALQRDDALQLGRERTDERDTALAQLRQRESDFRALTAAHEQELEHRRKTSTALSALQAEHETLSRGHRDLAASHETIVANHRALIAEHRHLVSLHDALHEEAAALREEAAALREEAVALREKADFLFFSLRETYRSLLEFELSRLGSLQRTLRRAYRLLTLRRGRGSSYDDALQRAHAYFETFELDKPQRPPGKLQLLIAVLSYMVRNPAGSLRSLSWPRLWRAIRVFRGSSPGDLATWVGARFPAAQDTASGFDPASLEPALDTLELDFATSPAPRVSIIVPVYNDYRMTANCLRSIHQHSAGIDYEVVIADDCSSDLTRDIETRMRGVHVVRTPCNLRFLRNCNHAARQARGEWLLFLNNDTAVTAGWLQALLDVGADAGVGVVGPKLLFADGRLQEAGGIVWRDASAWNFGRGDDPRKPAYNYRRDVDYVSGACLMVRAALWEQLGGFDERFAPAYYEDADLCFAAREVGWRVVYAPQSVVHHFEGVSNGTDLDSGVKQHQVTNQAVFREKWAQRLDREHFPNAEHVVHARDRSRRRPCILVIDHYVPHHDRDAGGRSTYQYIRLLLRLGCRVQLMGANFFPHQPYTDDLQALGVEVLVGESIARGLDDWLEANAPYIDEIFLHRPHVAEQFLPHLERLRPRPRISFFGHDLHYLRIAREAALKDDDSLRRESDNWRRRELAVCDRVDRVYYFSDIEIEELRPQVPSDKLRCVPLYAMEFDEVPGYDPQESQGLLFVGGYNHPPNIDAALWLADGILPRLQARLPGVHLHLVGSHPSEDVLALAGDSVSVHGYVSDERLAALYRRVAVAVVPLRYGAGVKGKVIEAVSHGVPLVTTDIGAEGIPDAESVMWIENTDTALVERLHSLLTNPDVATARLQRYPGWLRRNFAAEHAARVLAEDVPALSSLLT